jgi:hypothetical protein
VVVAVGCDDDDEDDDDAEAVREGKESVQERSVARREVTRVERK